MNKRDVSFCRGPLVLLYHLKPPGLQRLPCISRRITGKEVDLTSPRSFDIRPWCSSLWVCSAAFSSIYSNILDASFSQLLSLVSYFMSQAILPSVPPSVRIFLLQTGMLSN
ncbi:hypothetical protein ATANTOWER_031764 [Ataeniobius toweri]|uniref:Uncharacterized protein n=1 Tax=Ataeniobius toweri TaxID=208326 RepID=A0ABU7A9W4_9TELE|nr:hypothetical protein [Ataeniobius toweri]